MSKTLKRFLPLACCLLVAATAGADPIFSLEDPKGDDHGAGTLMYPNRDDLKAGDLDLVQLSAEQRSDGVWFIAEMAQPIRSPVGRVTEIGQTPMERLARNGFYTFNLDIYIDTDRIAGSGQSGTVPGRGVAVDRLFAWEKCIVLTPRPDIARTMMQMYFDEEFEAELRARQGRVSEDEVADLQAKSESRVEDLFFFPTRVRVSGRRIEFLVPEQFLGGVPSKSWGYTVLVTGADLEQTGRLNLVGKASQPTMMTMSVARGLRWSQWGIRSDADEATPPVVDVLAVDVSGRVQAGDGSVGVPDADVRVFLAGQGGPEAQPLANVQTDEEGEFQMQLIAPAGDVDFVATYSPDGETAFTSTATRAMTPDSTSEFVPVLLDMPVVYGTVYLDQARSLPAPSPNVFIEVDGRTYFSRVISGGRYRAFAVPEGTFSVRARSDSGLEGLVQDAGTITSPNSAIQVDVVLPPSNDVTVTVLDGGVPVVADVALTFTAGGAAQTVGGPTSAVGGTLGGVGAGAGALAGHSPEDGERDGEQGEGDDERHEIPAKDDVERIHGHVLRDTARDITASRDRRMGPGMSVSRWRGHR